MSAAHHHSASEQWQHNPAHYTFPRRTPPEHAHIPFADEAQRHQRRRVIAEALIGAAMLLAFLAFLVFAPGWFGLIAGSAS